MNPSITRPYKERQPVETIAHIQGILDKLDLAPDIAASANPYPGLHSVLLRLPPSKGSFFANGKGRTAEYCLASGYAEFIERLQNGHFGSLPRTLVASFRERYGFYYAPDEGYLTQEQLQSLPGDVLNDLVRYAGAERDAFLGLYAAQVKASGAPGVVAVPFYDTRHAGVAYLPLNLLLQNTRSNGMAAGNSLAEAIFQGCCEVMERWAAADVFHRQLVPPTIPPAYLQQFPLEAALIANIEQTGKYRVTVKDFSCGVGIPALGLLIENLPAHTYRLNIGCDTAFEVALSRCLTETYQGRENEQEFDLSTSPIPGQAPGCISDDSLAAQYQRFADLTSFMNMGEGDFPAALFGEQPSYAFSPQVWSPRGSYVEEVHRLIAFFHQAGHNVYIRDVSFLGFPSVLVYVPEISTKWIKGIPAPGLSALPLSIALAAIEGKTLKLKQCTEEDLAAVARVFERLPRASKLFEILGLELNNSSPWRDVNLAFMLAQIYIRLGQSGKALESLLAFLETRPEPYRYRYYTRVVQYLGLRAEGLSHPAAAQRLDQDPQWGAAGRTLADELADPHQAFQFMKLPNCPDCAACELQTECITTGALKIVSRLYPAMRHNRIEQMELAWVNCAEELEREEVTEKEMLVLLGRAVADEAFRAELLDDPRQAVRKAGYVLTEEGLAALKMIDTQTITEALDERLVKKIGGSLV